jgi:hypothetical protein
MYTDTKTCKRMSLAKKDEVVPVYTVKVYGRGRGTSPLILNLGPK